MNKTGLSEKLITPVTNHQFQINQINSYMRKIFLVILALGLAINLYSQNPADSIKWKTNHVIALFPGDYTHNNGLTITQWIHEFQHANGLHLEILGRGFATLTTPNITFMIPDTFDLKNLNDTLASWNTSNVNGLSISPFGLMSNSQFRGLSLNGFGFYIPRLQGVGISLMESQSIKAQGFIFAFGWTRIGLMQGLEIAGFNGCWILDGLQLGVSNFCNRGKGAQIGLFNKSGDDFKGIQIGLWNKIGKLPLPIINMKFKNKKKDDISKRI